MIKQRSRTRRSQKLHNPSQPQPVRQATTGDAAPTQVGVHRGVGGHQAGAARRRPLWCRRTPSKRRAQASAAVPADIKQAPRAGACKPILPMNWPTIYWIHDDGKKASRAHLLYPMLHGWIPLLQFLVAEGRSNPSPGGLGRHLQ